MRCLIRSATFLVAVVVLFTGWVAVPTAAAQTTPPDRTLGVLVVAHGSTVEWNAPVKAAVDRLRATQPAEASFLMGTREQAAQQAYDKLVAAGATRVVVVPLLVSSHSAHAEQVRFIGGARPDYPHAEHMALTQVSGPVPVVGVATALDDHPVLAAILTDRARALSQDPAREALVLVAHGPNDDEEAERWTANLRRLGALIHASLPFRDVDVRLLRDDAPKPVKDAALAELRASVDARAKEGRVLVVPVLLAPGRVADQVPDVLQGLDFAWDGRTVLPDDRVAEWLVIAARGADRAAATSSDGAARYEEQIVVTATRTERPLRAVPVHTDVIGPETIAASAPRSVADVLTHQVGIEVVPTLAGDGVQLQGVDARGVLLLVDGQEVIGKIGGGVDVANLLADDVERIEVVKGAASAVYGSDALGGVINIITRRATEPLMLSGEQRFESLAGRTTEAAAGARGGPWSGLFSAGRVSRDAYDLVPSEPTTTGSAFRKLALHGYVGRRLGDAADLVVRTRRYTERAADVTASRGVVYDDVVRDGRWQTAAELRTKPTATANLSVRGHVTRFRHDFDRTRQSTGAVTPDVTREWLDEAEVQYDQAAGTRHLVTVGGEMERLGMISDRISSGRRVAVTGVAFVQDEWFVHDRVRLLGGVRYDHNSEFGDAWSPKLAGLFTIAGAVRVRASYGEGFKAPEFKDLYYAYSNRAAGYQVVGNPDLRPESSRSLNAGLDADVWRRRLRFTLGVFRHQIDDLFTTRFVGRDPAAGLLTYQPVNADAARMQGVEAELTVAPASWVTGAVGYTYLDALDRATGEPLILRSRHAVKARLFARSDRTGTSAAIFARWLGRRAFADTDGNGRIDDYSPAFAIWDARLAQRIGDWLQVFVGADNLLGSRDARYLPSPGRRVYAGASVRYLR